MKTFRGTENGGARAQFRSVVEAEGGGITGFALMARSVGCGQWMIC